MIKNTEPLMKFQSLLIAVAATLATASAAQAAPAITTPLFYGPEAVVAGNTYDFQFKLDNSIGSASFVAKITTGAGNVAPTSMKLFDLSGATPAEVSFTSTTGGALSLSQSYAGLVYGNYYDLRIVAPVSGSLNINSKYVGVDFVSSISAVPEPESIALALAGLGVVGMLSRRRKSA
jgi:PEP-CTERM motif